MILLWFCRWFGVFSLARLSALLSVAIDVKFHFWIDI
jgi:hypothetical protein